MTRLHLLAATALASGMMIYNPAFAENTPSETEAEAVPAETTETTETTESSDTASSSETLVADNINVEANVLALPEWHYDELYAEGISVEEMIGADVNGPTGEDIGTVENVIFDSDGKILSIIAEVGGFVDIGDTHVNVPWDQVELTDDDDVMIPVTQDRIEDFTLFTDDIIGVADAASDIQEVSGDGTGVAMTGPRAWRATELIGDYARLKDGEIMANYGYVDDLILRDGQIAAVVVGTDVGYATPGRYAYPYYGYGYGWQPGSPYYDLPYDQTEVEALEPFDEDMMDSQS